MTDQPLSEQDERDLALLDPDDATPKRCLLETWKELLTDVERVRDEPIPVGIAMKTVRSWPFLTFQDTAVYHRRYHDLIIELREILLEAIRANPDALVHVGPEDGTENHAIYRDILVAWHLVLDTYEDDWRAEDPDAHIMAAILPDARAFFFSQVGLAGHLDSIGFSLADDEFTEALQAAREVRGE